MNEQEQIGMLKRDRTIILIALLLCNIAIIGFAVKIDKLRSQVDFWMNKALTIDARGK